MLGKAVQFAAARRMGAIPLAIVLIFGGFSAPLLASTRIAELEENSASKILAEELSLGHRTSAQRQLRTESGRVTTALTILSPHLLGHTQRPVLSCLRGHRLPNGLLAPLTC
jgi:hypothetical protein